MITTMSATSTTRSRVGSCMAIAVQSRCARSASPRAGHRFASAVLVRRRPSALASAPDMPRRASARWYAPTASATPTGRMSGRPHRFIAKYRTAPNTNPGLHFQSSGGCRSAGIERQSVSTPIRDMAARHTAPPIPATKPPATEKGTKRTRLASPHRPTTRKQTPAATAPIMSATVVVTKRVSPSAPIVAPTCAITMTSAGDSPDIAPRKPPARAMTRQAAKFPNSTRPTPWEEYGASGPENIRLPKATCATSSARPEVRPAASAGAAFAEKVSARNSEARLRSSDVNVAGSRESALRHLRTCVAIPAHGSGPRLVWWTTAPPAQGLTFQARPARESHASPQRQPLRTWVARCPRQARAAVKFRWLASGRRGALRGLPRGPGSPPSSSPPLYSRHRQPAPPGKRSPSSTTVQGSSHSNERVRSRLHPGSHSGTGSD